MPDIFDEVEEDLRAERARSLLRRYGLWLVAAAVLVVAGAGGYEYWRHRRQQAREEAAALFLAASRAAHPEGAATADAGGLSAARRNDAMAGFARVIAEGTPGYRLLARLRLAALKAEAGDEAGADALWNQVAADPEADQLLRDLAVLQWAQHQPDGVAADSIRARIAPLTAPTNPWRALALEQEAMLDLRAGARDQARDALRSLAQDVTAPQGVRGRATAMLQRLGG